ncbi:retrovirus-related Pol polyprotein from transposon 412 [Trichonephila clavipes]|nr:retrovirus-related Pol polyprotein from transposon 412 [Trichonephila clavipes]
MGDQEGTTRYRKRCGALSSLPLRSKVPAANNDVEKCCRICDPCAARKGPRKRTRGRLQVYNVGAPFERIAFDILGPLLRSSDGNNHILVVKDYFTKWPEAYPIPDQEASTVAEILVQH